MLPARSRQREADLRVVWSGSTPVITQGEALQGLTVVSVEQAVAAPLATRLLADYGARVIKIERPVRGDFARYYDTAVKGMSSYFVWTNRSKESVTLDLSNVRGRQVLHRLLAKADVFVQNLAPMTADAFGLHPEDVRCHHPRLIACEISGFGRGGPLSNRKAYDLLIQAEAGLLDVTGGEHERARAGISIADIAAGMHACNAILMALASHREDAAARSIEISMFDCLLEWMSMPLYYSRYGETPLKRTGAHHASICPYGPFRTKDGEIVLAVQHEDEWYRLCRDVLMDRELAMESRYRANESRVANREQVEMRIQQIVCDLPTSTIEARLEAAKLASARVNPIGAVWDHPQIRSRGRYISVETPVGETEMLIPPGLPRTWQPHGGVPELGEHTEDVLRWAGLSRAEQGVLRDVGII